MNEQDKLIRSTYEGEKLQELYQRYGEELGGKIWNWGYAELRGEEIDRILRLSLAQAVIDIVDRDSSREAKIMALAGILEAFDARIDNKLGEMAAQVRLTIGQQANLLENFIPYRNRRSH